MTADTVLSYDVILKAQVAIVAMIGPDVVPGYSHDERRDILRQAFTGLLEHTQSCDPQVSQQAYDQALDVIHAQEKLYGFDRAKTAPQEYLADLVLIAGDWYQLQCHQDQAASLRAEDISLSRAGYTVTEEGRRIQPEIAGRQLAVFQARTLELESDKSVAIYGALPFLQHASLEADPEAQLAAAMILKPMVGPNDQDLSDLLQAIAARILLDSDNDLPPHERIHAATTISQHMRKDARSDFVNKVVARTVEDYSGDIGVGSWLERVVAVLPVVSETRAKRLLKIATDKLEDPASGLSIEEHYIHANALRRLAPLASMDHLTLIGISTNAAIEVAKQSPDHRAAVLDDIDQRLKQWMLLAEVIALEGARTRIEYPFVPVAVVHFLENMHSALTGTTNRNKLALPDVMTAYPNDIPAP